MRLLALSAVLALLAAPALASDRHGGGHQPPRPGPCCGHGGGGGGGNVNINVNASAYAYAGASASSYLNARTYAVGGHRGGSYGGSVYVGGDYGGDAGYGYAAAPVYYDIDSRVLACASAPFGYVVTGFGRDDRRPPSCGGRWREEYEGDRGGRYGYSERHASAYEESYESFERYETYDEVEAYQEFEAYEDPAPAPYPPVYAPAYEPEPPPPGYDTQPYPYEPRPAPPRQEYRQEFGERG